MGTGQKSFAFLGLRIQEGEVCSLLHHVVNVIFQVAGNCEFLRAAVQPLSHSVRSLGTLVFDPRALALWLVTN